MKETIRFLYEIGSLRNLKRTWSQFLGPDVENVSEHSFRVAWLALAISKLEKKGNEAKIIKIALIHDIPESRSGDRSFVHSLYAKGDEQKAAKDSLKGTVFEKEFNQLFKEYKNRSSIEAKIVKDADTLEVDLELAELAEKGSKFMEICKGFRNKVTKTLYTKTAKKIYEQNLKAKPNQWVRQPIKDKVKEMRKK